MKKCLKKRILLILAVFVIVITATVLPISAAVPDGPSLVNFFRAVSFSGFEWYDGGTFECVGDTTDGLLGFQYSGTRYGRLSLETGSTFTYGDLFPNCVDGRRYYIAFDSPQIDVTREDVYFAIWVNGVSMASLHSGDSFVWDDSYSDVRFVFSVFLPEGVQNFQLTYCVLLQDKVVDRESASLLFTPYNPLYFDDFSFPGDYDQWYNEGYTAGYLTGDVDGYDRGYAEGYDKGSNYVSSIVSPMDVWTSVEIAVRYYNTSLASTELSSTITISRDSPEEMEYSLLQNGYFSPLGYIDFVLDRQSIPEGSTGYIFCSSCTMTINFGEVGLIPALYSFGGTYPFNTSFNVSVFNEDVLLGNKDVSLLGGGDSGNEGLYSYAAAFRELYGTANKVVISCIGGTTVDSPHTIEEYGFTVGIYGNPNEEAYANGLRVGATMGFGNAFESGEQQGIKDGYQLGFAEGKAEGLQIAQLGDWTDLMTAVAEAPINAFQSLFNFEILGLDMRAAFGSILALCVLLIIVKKVLL